MNSLQSTIAGFPIITYLGTLLMFMVPGLVLVHRYLREHLSGPVMIPVSFALSASIFALLGVPFLMLHRSLELYLLCAGAVVMVSGVAGVLGLRSRKPAGREGTDGRATVWLWVSFLVLGVVLAAVARMRVPFPYDDIWVYLGWVREYAGAERLALNDPYFGHPIGTSRALINGWLLIQAAFSEVSGIGSVELVLRYLAPTLVVMSLLAVYALARVLLKSETAALLVGSLYALGFLTPFGPKGELVSRIAEDKFASWFFFLPVGLIFAVLYLESRKLRYLLVFALFCWAVVAIHPIGLAILGLSTAGFGLFHLAANPRSREAWVGTVTLGGALLSVLAAPLLYLAATGDSLVAILKSADINSGDPDVLANMVFVREEWQRVLEFGDYYMVHPAQILEPAILVAFVVGLPFLFWRLRRSLAAQLLAGMLLVPSVVCFVPPIATFFGDHVIVPGQMWRLAWPIPLAASLTIGWMVWEVTRYARLGLDGSGGSRRVGRLLPLMVVCALIAAVAPASASAAEAVYDAVTGEQHSGRCFDPIFDRMRDDIEETSVILAPDMVSTCIPAYSDRANVVSLRGGLLLGALPALEKRVPGRIQVPEGALDVRRFFSHSSLEEKLRIIRRHKADYVMVRAGSSLNRTLKSQPGFTAVDTPGERFDLYAVDRRELARPV